MRSFALEFRRLGFERARILATFRMPWYAAAHGAWRSLGEARVAELVDEELEPFAVPGRE